VVGYNSKTRSPIIAPGYHPGIDYRAKSPIPVYAPFDCLISLNPA